MRLVPTLADATATELRAGGTDLMERLRSGRTTGEFDDLRDVAGLDRVEGGRIGAKVTIAALAAEATMPEGLRMAAGGLATPQIRAVATVGGNLLQHVRCWYYRNPAITCAKAGGTECFARAGDHLYHSCFQDGVCIAPHPSTLACALLAYDATVEDRAGKKTPLLEALVARPVIAAVHVPPVKDPEKATYLRAIARARAEWPLVEVTARWNATKKEARVAVGGVAPLPMRLPKVEAALLAGASMADAAKLASEGASPLPMTGYKVGLLENTVLEALERLA
jgi:xanthine dehydrogenase YagS FAD-binding subunit